MTWAIHSWSLIFAERPERINRGHSFLVSDLCNLLTLLIFGERPKWFAHEKRGNEWIAQFFFNIQKTYQKYNFSQIFGSNRSFAHLSWAIWANPSQSLICHEQTERFTHGCSFNISNLSDSLTVAHLIWAIWANERISKFPALENLTRSVSAAHCGVKVLG